MDINPWILGLLIVIGSIGWVSKYIPKLGGNDNPLEQAAEKIIKDESGYDIDLSRDN